MTTRYRVLIGVAAVGLLAAGCGSSNSGAASGGAAPTAAGAGTTTSKAAGNGQCDFTATPNEPAPSGHDFGTPPAAAPHDGTASVTLHTSQGDLPLSLPRAAAPCTVASFVFLAGKGYFNNSPCHRLTSADSLKVLQCGDPTGSGTGGPGYTIPDENPTNLAPSASGASVYPRGTLAMANTGQPHSGGSQFFLVYQDSMLPPQYAVFGTVGAAGLQVLDKVAAGGIDPGGNGPDDGKPHLPISITSATVAG